MIDAAPPLLRIDVRTLLLGALLLAACSPGAPPAPPRAAWVDEARLANADREPQNWYATNRGISEDHHSLLDGINEGNVADLGFAWQYDMETTRGLEASPVVIDGVLYTSGNWGKVVAIDARTGAELWRYDPQVPGEWARRACCDIVNRGVAAWKGRIYVGSLDGYLIALDAATGREAWRSDTLIDRTRYQTITGAPQIAGGKVVIGNAGAELGVRGYVTAFDAESGEFAWRFFTVPGDPRLPYEHPELEAAAKTWDPDSMWDVGGGGTAWDAMAYDPELDLLYVGTGNGSPHPIYSRSPAGGDNLFLSSILAIDPDTGRLKWHYQTTPGDSWDYTATQHMVLADLVIGGKPRKVLMQAPKNGFFYVLDRATGELLSAEKYGKATWAHRVDLATGRPVLTRQSDFSEHARLIWPGQAGAHNWHPMSFHPGTGLVYIPLLDLPGAYSYAPRPKYVAGQGAEHVAILDYDDPKVEPRPEVLVRPDRLGFLQAWDPVAGKERWRVPVSSSLRGGGILSTAGNLVFMGTGQGFLNAHDAETGALLASLNVGTSMAAAPISYAVDGEQYVAIMAGLGGSYGWSFPRTSAAYRYGNAGRIIAFKLGGGPVPIPPKVVRKPLPMPPDVPTSPALVARGEQLFDAARCTWCHSNEPGLVPNLLALTPEKHAVFKDIVLHGALESGGMAGFGDFLSESDAEAIQAYLVDAARREIAAGRGVP